LDERREKEKEKLRKREREGEREPVAGCADDYQMCKLWVAAYTHDKNEVWPKNPSW
jgi:hypothetical protein